MIMKSNQYIKITIIEDEKSYREALKELILSEKNNHIFGEFSNGKDFITTLKSSPFKPHICLIDLVLPDMSGLECAKSVREFYPEIKVILMTAYPSMDILVEAEKEQIDFIEKGTLGEVLINKIIEKKQSDDSDYFLFLKKENKECKEKNKEVDISAIHKLQDVQNRLEHLSENQRKILKLRQEGFQIQQISEKTGMSINTVKTHLTRATKKLNLPTVLDFLKF